MADHQDPEGSAAAKPRIALPKNIAQTLKYLDDIDLETLRLSVETEVQRRRSPTGAVTEQKGDDAPPIPSAKKSKVRRSDVPVPAGKVSLIKASAKSGLKPTAIARTLRISLAEVNRVLAVPAKPKR
ncbi:MAG: hypothetical protein KIT82_05225 [Bradyrhizobium sp.]|nr:hypothetical protein [Bradyrhizobium sp.]